MWEEECKILERKLADRGISLAEVTKKLAAHRIETPSWGYADSGTRFGVFHQPGVPRDVFEKIEDAAHTHRMTGLCPSVALHIPWDKTDDWGKLKEYAASLGVEIGAINPNVFQEECYKWGSLGSHLPEVRRRALDRHLECVDIMHTTGSKALSLWYADGTNYPGQADFLARKHWFEENLRTVYSALEPDEKMWIEYKFYEPAFYHTDIADWGMAYNLCLKLGPQASVLVDLGHHAQGVNIEHIVAILLDEGRLGGFHFNSRKYGDDDLTAGSINPYELFLIYDQLVRGEIRLGGRFDVGYLIDQSHNIKPKIEAMIQSLLVLQTMYAKALIVDRPKLAKARAEADVVTGEMCLVEAYNTDVEPLLRKVRVEKGLDPNPLQAHRGSGYVEEKARQRVGRPAGGLGA